MSSVPTIIILYALTVCIILPCRKYKTIVYSCCVQTEKSRAHLIECRFKAFSRESSL